MSPARRRLVALLAAVTVALGLPAPALAKSADVTEANVSLRLAQDASLLVSERLTFDYEGGFHASFRDIPLDAGESIPANAIQVIENGRRYAPGGCTVEGCTDQTGRFGVTGTPEGGGIRIVWHHNATDEQRTFTVAYRVIARDHVIAHDDVIDVYWQVWGDQWGFKVDRLTADLENAALDPDDPLYRVWGYPRDVEGETVRGRGKATLEASGVPAHQFVELRVTIPRRPGQNVSGAGQRSGEGLPGILAEEQEADDDFNSTFNKAKRWIGHNAVLLSFMLAAVSLGGLGVMRLMAREHALP